ncbi:MAG: hypothetical protein AAGE52_13895 [Myxococcota bacterium]
MGRLLGANDLGLRVTWRHRFVPPGTRAEPTPGVLYLDVGGGLRPGIIDHHGADIRPTSTAELILQHRELVYVHFLGGVLKRAAAGESVGGSDLTFTLVTHFAPDFDGVVSTYFVKHLVETGEFPSGASALARYVTEVDQGRYRLHLDRPSTFLAPHIGQLAIQNLMTAGDPEQRSIEGLERGLRLVERVLRDVPGARSPSQFVPDGDDHPASRWASSDEFQDARELLAAEPEHFAADFEAAERGSVVLPLQGANGGMEVPAFVATRPPTSKLNKYWVRASGYPFFVCPYATASDTEGRFGRVILSLDPTWTDDEGQTPSLRGLGFALERRECEVRAEEEGGDQRSPTPRWDDGTCSNADPWYDGRGHAFTIVDAPSSTTHLSYADVLAIARSGSFWHVPLSRGTITMMWAADLDAKGDAAGGPGKWEPLVCPPAIDDRMRPFYAACRALAPIAEELDCPGTAATREVRDFPPEARGGLRLLHIRAEEGATLEQLLMASRTAVERFGEPDYVLSRVQLGAHNADPGGLDILVRQLGDVDVDEVPIAPDELVLFNHRSLLVRGSQEGDDGYLEVLFYLAFVREALRDYQTRLSDLLRKDQRSRKDTKKLRRDILAFQTRYYDLEIARSGRVRRISERLVSAMHLSRSYGEIQDQMRQLAQLEAQDDARHRERADLFMESALFFVAIAGVFETIVAYLSWDGFQRKDWTWIGSLLAFFVVIWLVALMLRRRRRM